MRVVFFISIVFLSIQSIAQKSAPVNSSPKEINIPGITVTITKNSVMLLNGKKCDYTTYTGYLDLKNDTGKLTAKVFFTYYKKDAEDDAKRPICFTFNGGPGSSSVWLHMGGLGPKMVVLQEDGTAPPPPYQIINNPYTWLDKTDLVFIDPVATGYSTAVASANNKQFHGFTEDVQSVGSFIRSFLSRFER